MRFRFFFLSLGSITLASLLFYFPLNKQNLKDKNIILISIDTLRADHLSIYGYHRNTAPFIDWLAKESIVFEQAYSASDYTLSSHISIFTGLYPPTHKIVFHPKLTWKNL